MEGWGRVQRLFWEDQVLIWVRRSRRSCLSAGGTGLAVAGVQVSPDTQDLGSDRTGCHCAVRQSAVCPRSAARGFGHTVVISHQTGSESKPPKRAVRLVAF